MFNRFEMCFLKCTCGVNGLFNKTRLLKQQLPVAMFNLWCEWAVCHDDFNGSGSKLPQILTKYLCHTRNGYRTLRRYEVNFQDKENQP